MQNNVLKSISFFVFLVGGKLLHSVVLVSATQQCESVIILYSCVCVCVCVCIPLSISFFGQYLDVRIQTYRREWLNSRAFRIGIPLEYTSLKWPWRQRTIRFLPLKNLLLIETELWFSFSLASCLSLSCFLS